MYKMMPFKKIQAYGGEGMGKMGEEEWEIHTCSCGMNKSWE